MRISGQTEEISMTFKNKVAIVTGAAQGMGASYARLLAKHGAKVVLADINVDSANKVVKEITAAGGTAMAVKTDVGASESCKDCAAAAIEAYGGIDYLVNNAGLLSAAMLPPLHLIEEKDYQRVLSVNMHSCLFMIRAVLESMKARGGGAIVNTSSIGSWQAAGIYSLSKLGVNGITINLARELGQYKIRVNAIAPGTVDTPGMNPLMTVEQMSQWGTMLGRPNGEVAGPDLIAQVGVFLLSDEAHYLNGQVIPVDGGIMIRP
jgi:3-oxoacyl-[acyl-carrier protein] reductase